jgi:hypothetical protein
MRSTSLAPFLNTVFLADALEALLAMPTACVDVVMPDAMFGTAKYFRYHWGVDPARGDPRKHWAFHAPILQECRRVLKPGGILAWCQGFKFLPYFDNWFGPHRVWSPICTAHGLNFTPNIWVVQTREQQPIDHPNDMLVRVDRQAFVPLKKLHPCPKPVEEMKFLIGALTKPGVQSAARNGQPVNRTSSPGPKKGVPKSHPPTPHTPPTTKPRMASRRKQGGGVG